MLLTLRSFCFDIEGSSKEDLFHMGSRLTRDAQREHAAQTMVGMQPVFARDAFVGEWGLDK